MNVGYVTRCIVIFAAGTIGMNAQQDRHEATGPLAPLARPYKSVTYTLAKPLADDATAPFFSHGYVIKFRRFNVHSNLPNICIYNSSGGLAHELVVWPSGTAKLFLTSVDVGTRGQLAFAGRATKTDGTLFAFIATSNLDGTETRYFGTGEFLATQIALADNGSIWTVGSDRYTPGVVNSSSGREWKNFDTLRRYSTAGKILDHLLPRWGDGIAYVRNEIGISGAVTLRAYDQQNNQLADYYGPYWGPRGGYTDPSSIRSQTWLRAINDGVVLYDGRSGLLYRYSATTSSLATERVDIQSIHGTNIDGFAALNDGRIYASFQSLVNDASRNVGLFELIGKASGGLSQWSLVPRNSSYPRIIGNDFRLWGADGSAIVYRSSGGQVNWSELR